MPLPLYMFHIYLFLHSFFIQRNSFYSELYLGIRFFFTDIKSLTGEPDYRSVNLTWEVEDFENEVSEKGEEADHVPRQFIVYYCELQQWGAHRCKSKVKEDDAPCEAVYKQYSLTIDHLRMATKYSFHVKAQGQNKEQKASGRADLNGNILKDDNEIEGQTIIIPTKGCK